MYYLKPFKKQSYVWYFILFFEFFLMITTIDGCSCPHVVRYVYCCTELLMISNAIKFDFCQWTIPSSVGLKFVILRVLCSSKSFISSIVNGY